MQHDIVLIWSKVEHWMVQQFSDVPDAQQAFWKELKWRSPESVCVCVCMYELSLWPRFLPRCSGALCQHVNSWACSKEHTRSHSYRWSDNSVGKGQECVLVSEGLCRTVVCNQGAAGAQCLNRTGGTDSLGEFNYCIVCVLFLVCRCASLSISVCLWLFPNLTQRWRMTMPGQTY